MTKSRQPMSGSAKTGRNSPPAERFSAQGLISHGGSGNRRKSPIFGLDLADPRPKMRGSPGRSVMGMIAGRFCHGLASRGRAWGHRETGGDHGLASRGQGRPTVTGKGGKPAPPGAQLEVLQHSAADRKDGSDFPAVVIEDHPAAAYGHRRGPEHPAGDQDGHRRGQPLSIARR